MIYLASLTEEISDKVEGYYPIKTKEELDIIICNNKQNNKVIIRSDFAREYFTPSGLMQYIDNAKILNRNLLIELDETSVVLTQKKFLKKMSDATEIEDIFNLMTTFPKEFMDCIEYLMRDEKAKQKELLNASGDVSRLQAIIDELKVKLGDRDHRLNIEQGNKLFLQSKLEALISRINYQYNANIDERNMFVIDSNQYDKVIYIKEITRVQYTDSFVYYLKEILKVLYSMPTRLTVIEGFYASGKERLYPDLKPHHKLTEEDVLSGDILMLGVQPKLLTDILKNPSNVSILIVLDRAGFISPHVKGKNVEYFYTASDVNDIPKGVPDSRIISYSDKNLFVPMVPNFEELDMGERITKYSSFEIIKRIVALVEGRC